MGPAADGCGASGALAPPVSGAAPLGSMFLSAPLEQASSETLSTNHPLFIFIPLHSP
jgi:hypothetical protein